MKDQLAVQNLLREKLGEIQRQNPRYSLRSFSKKVGVHVGALTHIMNGKRNVSRKMTERLLNRLLVDPQRRSEILALFPQKRAYRKPGVVTGEVIEPRYLELTAAQFRISADWEHFAVMSLVKCEGFDSSNSWIARRLGITESRAKQVVERLVQLGLFNIAADGKMTRSEKSYRTPDDVADLTLKRHHEQSLELAKESLFRDKVSARDFTTLTMAIDPEKIPRAKELIRKYQDELSDVLGTDRRTDVYRLSIQLFPLTRIEE